MALRWVHLVLGGALLMPYHLLMLVLIPLALPDANPFQEPALQFVALAAALPLAAVTALAPVLRPLEAAAARSLCGTPKEQLAEGPAESWAAKRRTALWFVLHLGAGGIVSGMTLAAPPAAVALLAMPFVPALRDVEWAWVRDLHAVAVTGLGLGLLALVVGTAWGAGALLARCAPALLGPTPADRLAAAERRAADLASRNRLARELHDSVGHALSAVTLQASAARRLLDSDAEFVRQALAAIEETTRAAVSELDTVLGLLRQDDARGPASPAPTLQALEELLERTRAAGVEVRAKVTGERDRLPPVASREAYRIVQEGLTNALRHAGRVPVELTIAVHSKELRITMENRMTGAGAARPGGGHGLSGIAERAALLGGGAQSGPHEGVWRLAVRIPVGSGG